MEKPESLGVGHGPVDKAPGCCKVALGSYPPAQHPQNGVIQGGWTHWTAHRVPHQNSWMNSPTEKQLN